MGRRQVYDQVKIATGRKKQIKTFTSASQRNVYQGQVRRTVVSLGGPDKAVTLNDPAILAKIDDKADELADSIVRTYNRMLDEQLAAMPDGLTDEQLMYRLDPFFDAVRLWNRQTLIPYTTAWTRQQAVFDVFKQNEIEVQWMCVPPETDQTDACLAAIAASPMSSDEAYSYEMPNHRRCPHSLAPILPHNLSLPDGYWDGDLTATEAA